MLLLADDFTDTCFSRPAAVSATATSAEDQDVPFQTLAVHNMARAGETGVPKSIQDALVNDMNAPRSLAEEFSGDKTPNWYNDLSEEQRQLFKAPKTTDVPIQTDGRLYADCSLSEPRQSYAYQDLLAKWAKHDSGIAKEMSKAAKRIPCSDMSKVAKTASQDASKAYARAEASKRLIKKQYPKQWKTSASPTVSVPKSSAIFAFTLAVASLGVASCL